MVPLNTESQSNPVTGAFINLKGKYEHLASQTLAQELKYCYLSRAPYDYYLEIGETSLLQLKLLNMMLRL